jgi:hypothetical protein
MHITHVKEVRGGFVRFSIVESITTYGFRMASDGTLLPPQAKLGASFIVLAMIPPELQDAIVVAVRKALRTRSIVEPVLIAPSSPPSREVTPFVADTAVAGASSPTYYPCRKCGQQDVADPYAHVCPIVN